jgi:hypothetical protein
MTRPAAIFALALCAFAIGGASMAFGKMLVLASPLAGRLVDGDGGAVPGVTVVRSWQDAYTGDSGRDEWVTDGDGRFAFGEAIRSGALAGIVPHTPSITQKVEALLPDGPRLLLALDKHDYEMNGEIREPERRNGGIRLTCRADAEASDQGWYWGTCILDH